MVHCERAFERKAADGTVAAMSRGCVCGSGPERPPSSARAPALVRPQPTSAGDAHERALKAAETDATKRALATFGGRFGLMLYDKEQRPAAATTLRSLAHPD